MRGLVALMLLTAQAFAEPPPILLYLHSPRFACRVAEVGDCIDLPAGYFMDERTYNKLDVEMKRLQDEETRLKAENASLKQTGQSGLMTVVTTFVVGAAVGIFLDRKL